MGFTLKQNFYSQSLKEQNADHIKPEFHLELFLEQQNTRAL